MSELQNTVYKYKVPCLCPAPEFELPVTKPNGFALFIPLRFDDVPLVLAILIVYRSLIYIYNNEFK